MEELSKWHEACSGVGFAIFKEVVRVASFKRWHWNKFESHWGIWPYDYLGRSTAGREGTAIANALRQEHAWYFEKWQGGQYGWRKRKRWEGQITQVLWNHFREFDFDAEGTGKSHWGVLSWAGTWSGLWFKGSLWWLLGWEWIVGGQGEAGRIVRSLLKESRWDEGGSTWGSEKALVEPAGCPGWLDGGVI